jgi:tyrosinase
MALRKNQSSLTSTEKKQLTDAVLKLKAGGSPGNRYDELVLIHEQNMTYGHFGPAFFAWHREYLLLFEQALQNIMNDQSIALPYWDWTANQSANSFGWPFTADFLGGNGQGSYWQVMDGPFAYDTGMWPLTVRTGTEPYSFLMRRFGPSQQPPLSLPTPANVQAALQATPYDVPPWNITSPSGLRNRAEGNIPFGMHNLVHMWVGGSMTPFTSPNDPVFWLHHCYVDRLWSDWQILHPDQVAYLPREGAPIKGHNLYDAMPPWTVRPVDVLSTWDHGYHYDTDGFLVPGEVLYPGQTIYSMGDHRYYLAYETDGNLRLWLRGWGNYLWQSSDSKKPLGKCTMESQGNLVIRDNNNNKIWESKTDGHPGSYLVVRPDGHATINQPGVPKPIWIQPPEKG